MNVFCSSTVSVISSWSRCAGMPDSSSADVTMLDQVAAVELGRRKIDRDLDVLRPIDGFVAGRLEHPFAERHDQPGLLGDRDELGRRNEAARRVVPAQQRLERR